MNRETRRANLKRLQLQSNGSGDNKRRTRSSKSSTAPISQYFDTPPAAKPALVPALPTATTETSKTPTKSPSPQPSTSASVTPVLKTERKKRTKLTAFLLRDSDAFESPIKQIKKAPKIRKIKTVKARSNKRQPNIKSAFMRNEQLFAEITTQHCMADNFNADEVKLALALSKSEAEALGGCGSAVAEDVETQDAELDADSLRQKLQTYGFRTAAREDYQTFASTFLPGIKQRRQKVKWANKFTALTLRNADVQLKKINAKAEEILALYCTKTQLTAAESYAAPYTVTSDMLHDCQVQRDELRIVKSSSTTAMADLQCYFVLELFPMTSVTAGYLLKDWRTIQGRDLSPQPRNQQSRLREEKLHKVYEDLERHYNNCRVLELTMSAETFEGKCQTEEEKNVSVSSDGPVELSAMLALIEALPVESASITDANPAALPNAVPAPDQQQSLAKDNNEISLTLNEDAASETNVPITEERSNNSPDIFADSDAEVNDISLFATCELYTSDEMKDSSSTAAVSPIQVGVITGIDLTQDDDNDMGSDQLKPETLPTGNHCHEQQYGELGSIDEEIAENGAAQEDFGAIHFDVVTPLWDLRSPRQSADCGENSYTRGTQRSLKTALNTSVEMCLLQRRSKSALLPLQAFAAPTSIANDTPLFSANTEDNADTSCIVLSDEELELGLLQLKTSIEKKAEFSYLDMIAADGDPLTATTSSQSLDCELSNSSDQLLTTPRRKASDSRFDFGILESPSQSLSQIFATARSPTSDEAQSCEIPEADASFLYRPSESAAPMRRFRSEGSMQKFNTLLEEVRQEQEAFDEIDRLVYGSPKQKHTSNDCSRNGSRTPTGFQQLLTADISFRQTEIASSSNVSPYVNVSKSLQFSETVGRDIATEEEVTIDGRVYTVRPCSTPKPDYITWSEPELLRQLYVFGIKPLNRKQAVKILEHIYSQTHPIIESKPQPIEISSEEEIKRLCLKYGCSLP